MLSNTRVHVDTLTTANALLQSQLAAQHVGHVLCYRTSTSSLSHLLTWQRAAPDPAADPIGPRHDLKNMKIAELTQTIANLKEGFRVR